MTNLVTPVAPAMLFVPADRDDSAIHSPPPRPRFRARHRRDTATLETVAGLRSTEEIIVQTPGAAAVGDAGQRLPARAPRVDGMYAGALGMSEREARR